MARPGALALAAAALLVLAPAIEAQIAPAVRSIHVSMRLHFAHCVHTASCNITAISSWVASAMVPLATTWQCKGKHKRVSQVRNAKAFSFRYDVLLRMCEAELPSEPCNTGSHKPETVTTSADWALH